MNTKKEDIQVLIFQTNISQKNDVDKAGKALKDHEGILDWSIDTGDIDKVLRVEAEGIEAKDVIDLMINEGFFCKELND